MRDLWCSASEHEVGFRSSLPRTKRPTAWAQRRLSAGPSAGQEAEAGRGDCLLVVSDLLQEPPNRASAPPQPLLGPRRSRPRRYSEAAAGSAGAFDDEGGGFAPAGFADFSDSSTSASGGYGYGYGCGNGSSSVSGPASRPPSSGSGSGSGSGSANGPASRPSSSGSGSVASNGSLYSCFSSSGVSSGLSSGLSSGVCTGSASYVCELGPGEDVAVAQPPPQVWVQGRDLLDLGAHLRGSWPLRFTDLPRGDVSFFFNNRSQYHRLGPGGDQMLFRELLCTECGFRQSTN